MYMQSRSTKLVIGYSAFSSGFEYITLLDAYVIAVIHCLEHDTVYSLRVLLGLTSMLAAFYH